MYDDGNNGVFPILTEKTSDGISGEDLDNILLGNTTTSYEKDTIPEGTAVNDE